MHALLALPHQFSPRLQRLVCQLSHLIQPPCPSPLQALLALPHQFSPRLQRLVHRGVSFSAPAARVRKAGDDCLEGMLQRQEVELQSLVDGLEGFQSLDGPGAIR